jgi:hypothetical protein
MARSPSGKRGRNASDFSGTLSSLLRTTLAQAGAMREVLERGARSGRARLDEVLSDRKRSAALADLGEIVLELVRQGEIDLEELPEIRQAIETLDRIDGDGDGDGDDESAAAPLGRDDFRARDEIEADDNEDREDDNEALRRALSGVPGPRFDDRDVTGRDSDRGVDPRRREDQVRRQAPTLRLRTGAAGTSRDVEPRAVAARPGQDRNRGRAPTLGSALRGKDGSVASSSWKRPATVPPPESSSSGSSVAPSQRIWRPVDPYARPRQRAPGSSPLDEVSPLAPAHQPDLLDLNDTFAAAHSPGPSESARPAAKDAARSAAVVPGQSDLRARGGGGISFDDDLDEYMHPDDVPKREP